MKRGKTIFIILCIVSMLAFFSCSSEPNAAKEHVHSYDEETNRCSCGEFDPKALFSITEITDRRFKTLQAAGTYIGSLYPKKGIEDKTFTLEVLGDVSDSGVDFSDTGDVDGLKISLTFPNENSKLTISEGGTGIVIPSGVSMTLEEANITSKNDDAPIITSNGTVEIKDSVIETESSTKPAISCGENASVTINNALISTSSENSTVPTIVSSGTTNISGTTSINTSAKAPAIEVTSGSVNVTGDTTINDGDSSKQAISIAPTAGDSVEVSFDENFKGSVSGTISVSEEAKSDTTLEIKNGRFDVNGLDKVSEKTSVTLGGEDSVGKSTVPVVIIPEKEIETVTQKSTQKAHVCLYSLRYNETSHWLQCTCGKTTETDSHDSADEKIVKKSTCTEKGEKELYCSVCSRLMGTTETDLIDHNYKSTVINPTCVTKGYTEHICEVCGFEKRDNETSLVEHDFVFSTQTDSTCKELGVKVSICSVCQLKKEEEIALKAHNFGEWTTVGSKEYRTCNDCGTKEEKGHVHEFNEGVIKTSATCLAPAVYTYSCECGYTEDRTKGDSINHEYTQKHDDTYHWDECGLCGHVKNQTTHLLSPERIEPTCISDGSLKYTCSCGYESDTEVLPKTNHTDYISSRTDAGCEHPSEDGKIVHSCIKCHQELYTETIEAKHVFQYVKKGESYIWECTKCHDKIDPVSISVDDSMLGIRLGLFYDSAFTNKSIPYGEEGTIQAVLTPSQSATYTWTWDDCNEPARTGDSLKIGGTDGVQLCIGKHNINVKASFKINEKIVNCMATSVISVTNAE